MIGIINEPLLLHLVGCLYYCISDAQSYKLITKRAYMKFMDTMHAFIPYLKCSKGLPSTFSSSKCSWNTCTYRLTNLSIVIKIIMCTNFLLLNIECQVTFAPAGILFAQNFQWPGSNQTCVLPKGLKRYNPSYGVRMPKSNINYFGTPPPSKKKAHIF